MNNFTRIAIATMVVGVAAIGGGLALQTEKDGIISASNWVESEVSKVRLISAVSGVGHRSQIQIAIQIELEPEWKTYWRHPGEAGIPPRFDWSGSDNLGEAAIGWPAPSRYYAYGLETVGYKDEVVFPIVAKVTDPGRELSIDLALDYAVCRNICVPLTANLTLRVPEGKAAATPFADKIKLFSDRIPVIIGPGAKDSAPRLTKLDIESRDGKERLRAEVRGIKETNDLNLFVEAGDNFGFGPSDLIPNPEAGIAEFLVPIFKYRKNAVLEGAEVRVTAVTNDEAYEWRRRLRSD